jgi:hypothetical protein
MNDDEVIILRGLEDDDHVLLTPPQDHDQLALVRLPAADRNVPVAGGDTALRPRTPAVTDTATHPSPPDTTPASSRHQPD